MGCWTYPSPPTLLGTKNRCVILIHCWNLEYGGRLRYSFARVHALCFFQHAFQQLLARMLSLKDIVPAALNNINTKFILLEKRKATAEGQDKTCLALVADETAAVHFQLWGTKCDAFEPGDIILLTNGIFSYDRNKQLVLRAGKKGKAEKVGEFTLAFVETPNMSEIRWGPNPNNSKTQIQEAVISPYSRIFPPQH